MKACVHRDEDYTDYGYPPCTTAIADAGTDPYCHPKQHFRGFKATWEKTAGATETHEFGDCSDYYTWSEDIPISEEIVAFTMNVDSNDIEGLAFRDFVQAQDSTCDQNPISTSVYQP